ncbi:hypothetical protein LTR09_005733 [Extremus antarcticus]|uniref:DM2 domain-containing protein n=1 Tax=Extremus antarcticus TaxID=702011 RepID=A0AAJ0DFK5_9PEZI|nr:hypothetical protein LTR09_005733 [Extremus antarcticus]
MASDLPPEQEAAYCAIIDDILANSDLTTVSAKRIRKGLQEKVDYDITAQKDAITALIMQRFDKVSKEQAADADSDPSTPAAPEPAPTTNGAAPHVKSETPPSTADSPELETKSAVKRKAPAATDSDADSLSDVADTPSPAKKLKKAPKVKKVKEEESDEQLAIRMQKELNAGSARSTRGGGVTKKKAPARKQKAATPKKKSKAKINSDDDSEVEDGEKPEREKKGGFHKPMAFSDPLAALLGTTSMSRPQTVKHLWKYIKANELQDPSDKRTIVCDDAMRAVFKQDRVHMFTMNKLLNAGHLFPMEEEAV